MKHMIFGAMAALGMIAATPALAAPNSNFTGIRAEMDAGYTNVNQKNDFNTVTYSAAVGGDIGIGNRLTVGIEGNASDVFSHQGRTYGAGARVGVALTPSVLVFGRVGYTNVRDRLNRNLDGVAYGGGVNIALTHNLYGNIEYRRSSVTNGVRTNGAQVGVGIRF